MSVLPPSTRTRIESPRLPNALGRARIFQVVHGVKTLSPWVPMGTAVVALCISFLQLGVARQAVRDGAVADVVNRSGQILQGAAADPEVFGYFELDLFGGGTRRGLDDLRRADRATRLKVQAVCEALADLFEATYDQRATFAPDDWRKWWAYMRQVHAESPALREFLRQRAAWYTIARVIGH